MHPFESGTIEEVRKRHPEATVRIYLQWYYDSDKIYDVAVVMINEAIISLYLLNK